MTLRNLDPGVTEALRQRAEREGRSLNSLICDLLARAVEDDLRRERMREQRPRVDALARQIEEECGPQTPSEILIREDRDR